MLYIIATPIGNRSDISLRAIDALKSCDYILCEDTRHSRPLLRYHGIGTALKSYHKFSEAKKEKQILEDLEANLNIGLISDGGTPTISDPGARLVEACHERKIPVTSVPGACAAITALSISGLPCDRFQFLGFLPKKEGLLKKTLSEALEYPGTTICYESPHRIEKVIKCLVLLAPNRQIALCRELTKKFETIYRGFPSDISAELSEKKAKGEMVLLLTGCDNENNKPSMEEIITKFNSLIIKGINRSEAIRQLSQQFNIPKNQLYSLVHKG